MTFAMKASMWKIFFEPILIRSSYPGQPKPRLATSH
jgi:hypothetical protein